MLLTRQQVAELDERKLREFLGRSHPEGHYLDYKVALSGESDREQKREFLKDVTGFANALGGHLLIGVKEPAEGQEVEAQLAGIANGEKVSEALENVVRDCTEPRIPGFFVRSISLASGSAVLVAHVPNSAMRPHMVNHGGHRTFYVRRHVSTVPMTVSELRDSILYAATSEGRARELFAVQKAKAMRYHQRGAPLLLLQAAPLTPPAEPWPVEDQAIMDIVRGSDRIHRFHSFGFATQYSPTLTIDGVIAMNDPEKPRWVWEVHRSGYVCLMARLEHRKIDAFEKPVLRVYAGFHDVFFVLAEILAKCWTVTTFDASYAYATELFPAHDSVFLTSRFYNESSEICHLDEIVWPTYMRQPGAPPQDIARQQIVALYHAYGQRPPQTIVPLPLS